MTALASMTPLAILAISLVAVPAILSSRTPNIREGWTFAAAAIMLGLVLSLLPAVLAGDTIVCPPIQVLPDVAIFLRVDAFGMLFALVASSLWLVTSLYSVGYMRGLDEHSQTRFFAFFALSLTATVGVAFAGNLLTLYLFYEMLSLATYPLVTHHQDANSRLSGRKYLIYLLGPSVGLVLPAMIAAHTMGGRLDFSGPGGLAPIGSPHTLALLLICLVFGFAKSGIMPLHAWLPAAMVAPTPVSALLHAVAVVKVGVFCVLRVLGWLFGPNLLQATDLSWLVIYPAAATVILASLIALSQDEIKRRLAYSTVGQLSYIILGAALLSPKGMTGAMLHIAMHAVGKITLFFCAGSIFVATGIKHISQMDGLGRRMPLTMSAFFIGALSVIGLPPCGGFISKWYLVLGTLEAGRPGMLVVILVSSLLNAAYFLPPIYRAFFSPARDAAGAGDGVKEAPRWCLVPPMLTAAACLVFFFYPQPFLALARVAVSVLFGCGGG